MNLWRQHVFLGVDTDMGAAHRRTDPAMPNLLFTILAETKAIFV